MRKQLFLDLQKKILDIKDNNNTALVQFFDIWHSNINFTEQPFDTPAVFIEFEPMSLQTLPGCKKQLFELSFILHIVSRYYPVTHSTAPENIQQQNLDFLDIPETIHSVLHMSRLEYSGTIIHTKSSLDYSFNDQIQALEYYTCVVGYEAKKEKQSKKIMISNLPIRRLPLSEASHYFPN